MNKQGPSLGKIAVMVGFALSCFGLLLFLWVAFGGPIPLGPKGYRVQASFNETTQLAIEADVRISGVPVGKVKKIEPDKRTGRADVEMELVSRYSPLPSDVKAILRQKTLLGETYVELTPGTKGAKKIPEGGRIAASAISPTVELDEIFRTFDPRTRRAFQGWADEQARAIKGHGRDLNDALGNLGPFAEDASTLVRILNRQEGAVTRLVRDGGIVFEALNERDGQLASMITNLNLVFRATASRDSELQEAFTALPTFQRESRTTLDRLTRFARATDPLIDQLRPAARQLSPTLIDLKALAPDLKLLFRDLDKLISASRTGFPALRRLLDDLRPTLQQLDPALKQVQPMIQFGKLHLREITAFFANTVAATQATDTTPGTDEKVHYLRTTNPVNLENLAAYPRRIGSNRPVPYVLPNGFDKLKDGLEVFEDRHCGRGVPIISQIADPILAELLPPDVQQTINETIFPVTSQAQTPAPPCKKQAPFDFQGERLQYPHVKPAP